MSGRSQLQNGGNIFPLDQTSEENIKVPLYLNVYFYFTRRCFLSLWGLIDPMNFLSFCWCIIPVISLYSSKFTRWPVTREISLKIKITCYHLLGTHNIAMGVTEEKMVFVELSSLLQNKCQGTLHRPQVIMDNLLSYLYFWHFVCQPLGNLPVDSSDLIQYREIKGK